MNQELKEKYEKLKLIIRDLGKVLITFSGGVDSTLLLEVSYDALKENAVAITADSPSLPRRELEETKKIAKQIGIKHIILNTEETKNPSYLKNPINRCYFCKSELYTKVKNKAKELGISNILNGINLDDLGDYRPGISAAIENRIISPLKDAKLTKKDVRDLAKYLGLEVWGKPASPCLSSRIPYGKEVTLSKLLMIEKAENFLKDFGIKELRVRHFGKTARIEVNQEDKGVISNNFNSIQKKFNEIGFSKIEVANFRSGNLNLMINIE